MTTNFHHAIVNPFMKIKHKNSLYQMIQNQGSLHLFIQTVMCVLNDLVELNTKCLNSFCLFIY